MKGIVVGEIKQLLDEHGFVLQRQSKHAVWRNPEGKVWVCSVSPSDHRTYANALGDLKRTIGVKTPKTPPKAREGKIRRHRRQPAPASFVEPTASVGKPTMREQLEALFKDKP
jgi:hypothetical protein